MAEDNDPKKPEEGEEEQAAKATDLPAYEESGGTEDLPIEDMNSTMMSIDVNALRHDDVDDTKQNIKVHTPTDDEIIQEQLESKKSPVARFFSQIGQSLKSAKRGGGEEAVSKLPKGLQGLVGVWISPPGISPFGQIVFYLTRLVILIVGLSAQFFLVKALVHSFQVHHPAKLVFLALIVVNLLLWVLVILKKYSPGWLLTLPYTALAAIFALGAFSYHTSDPLYFSLQDKTIADILNAYFTIGFLYVALVTLGNMAKSLPSRILWGVFCLLGFVPLGINAMLGVTFEQSFWGEGFLAKIPSTLFQPTFLFLHGLIPLGMILFLAKGFLGGKSDSAKVSKGFSLSLAPLFLGFFVLGVGVMQKNRVFHVFNLVVDQKLLAGTAQLDVLGNSVLLTTKGTQKNLGDTQARYRMSLKPTTSESQYRVEVFDGFEVPVHNLSKSDFRVKIDEASNKDFQFVLDPSSKSAEPVYLFKVNLKKRDQALKWVSRKESYGSTENLLFEVDDPAGLAKLAIKEGSDTLFEQEGPFEGRVKVPLSYFEAGKRKLLAVGYDSQGQELAKLSLPILIEQRKEFLLVAPLEQDSVSEAVSVLLYPKGFTSTDITSVSYSINGNVVTTMDHFSSLVSLDLSEQPQGELNLNVEVETAQDGKLTQSVKINHVKTMPHRLSIVSPTQGSFAERETQVQYNVKGSQQQKLLGVKVKVNGTDFDDFEVKDNQFTLPTALWKGREIYISVQATLENGKKTSDWVQINRGQTQLALKFQNKTLRFLNLDEPAVVLDASVSNWDSWQARSKWESYKEVLLAPEISARLEELRPSVYVFGSETPYYFESCDDARRVVRAKKFSKAELKKQLDKVQPKGASSLVAGLKKALSDNPQKIFLFADGGDTCDSNVLQKLRSRLKDKSTQIVVFAMGQIPSKQVKELQKLAEETKGAFYQPQDYDNLLKLIAGELSLKFELLSAGKTVFEGELKDQSLDLAPGEYVLRIPFGNQHKELTFPMEHGVKKLLTVRGKSRKIYVDEERGSF